MPAGPPKSLAINFHLHTLLEKGWFTGKKMIVKVLIQAGVSTTLHNNEKQKWIKHSCKKNYDYIGCQKINLNI